MTSRRTPVHAVLVVAAAGLALAACATTSSSTAEGPHGTVATASPAAKPSTVRAIELLDVGRREDARAELTRVLARQPKNAGARRLLEQIDCDPVEMLGSRSYPYRVKSGESLPMLADRFLGDPLLFYVLARYNGIDIPQAMTPGQILRIPGAPVKASLKYRFDAPPSPEAAVAHRDPERASKLRSAALEQISGGAVDSAIRLLKQAQQLDPDSMLIRRDLDRATRIQTAARRRL